MGEIDVPFTPNPGRYGTVTLTVEGVEDKAFLLELVNENVDLDGINSDIREAVENND